MNGGADGGRPVPVVICADDYGLSPGLGVAIRHLIDRGRVTATSCMTAGPHWPDEARALTPLMDRADIGLHLTLTDQAPAGPMPILAPEGRLPSVGRLMALAHTGRLPLDEIAAELDRQLDRFTTALGRPPDHIDGHQHVHQLPGVRDLVVRAAARWPGCYLRVCDEPLSAIVGRGVAAPKAALLSVLGWGLRRRARRAGVPACSSFRGVYDLTNRVPYGALMARFLSPAKAGALIMVHPGQANDAILATIDTLVDQRAVEADWLDGDAFPAALAQAGAVPGRFGSSR